MIFRNQAIWGGLLLLVGTACSEDFADDCALEDLERPLGWETLSHCKGIPPDYALVFDDTVVQRLDIVIDPDDYAATMDDLQDILGSNQGPGGNLDDTPEPMYIPVDLTYNDLQWTHVGMRYKGNSSLHSSWRRGVEKLAFRFNFDKFEDDYPEIHNQRFYGFKKMTFSNGFKDDSLLRDKVAADLFREAGAPAAQGAFVRVYMDVGEGPVYYGLYTMIEDPSDEMLEVQFDDGEGNLYKPEGEGAHLTTFIESSFEKKTHEDLADFTDVKRFIETLNGDRSDAAQWRARLEDVFNVDRFLQVQAANQVMVNWDSYGTMDHNYYLYADPSDAGRIVFFPWDLNEAMLIRGGGGGGGGGGPSASTSIMMDEVSENWPLIRYVLDDPIYREQYKGHVRAFLEGAFRIETVHEKLARYHELIAPYVDGTISQETYPYTHLERLQDFEGSVDDSARGLKAHVDSRHAEANRVLAQE